MFYIWPLESGCWRNYRWPFTQSGKSIAFVAVFTGLGMDCQLIWTSIGWWRYQRQCWKHRLWYRHHPSHWMDGWYWITIELIVEFCLDGWKLSLSTWCLCGWWEVSGQSWFCCRWSMAKPILSADLPIAVWRTNVLYLAIGEWLLAELSLTIYTVRQEHSVRCSLYWTWDGLSTDLNFNWMMTIPKTMLKASSLVSSSSKSLDGWLILDYNRIDRGVLSWWVKIVSVNVVPVWLLAELSLTI